MHVPCSSRARYVGSAVVPRPGPPPRSVVGPDRPTRCHHHPCSSPPTERVRYAWIASVGTTARDRAMKGASVTRPQNPKLLLSSLSRSPPCSSLAVCPPSRPSGAQVSGTGQIPSRPATAHHHRHPPTAPHDRATSPTTTTTVAPTPNPGLRAPRCAHRPGRHRLRPRQGRRRRPAVEGGTRQASRPPELHRPRAGRPLPLLVALYPPKPVPVVQAPGATTPPTGNAHEPGTEEIGDVEHLDDARAAYTHASCQYTGNQANANKAIEIMNAWSSTSPRSSRPAAPAGQRTCSCTTAETPCRRGGSLSPEPPRSSATREPAGAPTASHVRADAAQRLPAARHQELVHRGERILTWPRPPSTSACSPTTGPPSTRCRHLAQEGPDNLPSRRTVPGRCRTTTGTPTPDEAAGTTPPSTSPAWRRRAGTSATP